MGKKAISLEFKLLTSLLINANGLVRLCPICNFQVVAFSLFLICSWKWVKLNISRQKKQLQPAVSPPRPLTMQ